MSREVKKARSPLKVSPLRNPGQSLDEGLQKIFLDSFLPYFLAPPLLVAIALIEWWRWYRFLQVLAGPRQVGKTTLARQAMEGVKSRSHYASADEPTLQGRSWIEQQWDLGCLKAKDGEALPILNWVE